MRRRETFSRRREDDVETFFTRESNVLTGCSHSSTQSSVDMKLS